jgi:hypothetical protein
VENQLLGHEVPIELEHLVRERDNYSEKDPELQNYFDRPICHRGNMRPEAP